MLLSFNNRGYKFNLNNGQDLIEMNEPALGLIYAQAIDKCSTSPLHSSAMPASQLLLAGEDLKLISFHMSI